MVCKCNRSPPRALLSSDFRGALAENVVMQSLSAGGARSFYWMPETNGARGEIEFVIQTAQGEVIPVGVKSGKNVTAKSLKRFMKAALCTRSYRLSENQFGLSRDGDAPGELRSLPLYAAFCLGEL